MTESGIWTTDELKLYEAVLDFLEEAYGRRGQYEAGDAAQESAIDVLTLNLVKVVNDCRAILLLVRFGFYIQAGIIARSTEDACSFMMHIVFEGEDAELVDKWLLGERVTHYMMVKKLNERLSPEGRLDVANYRRVRRRLDSFVHANYDALRLYPAQAPGLTTLDSKSFQEMTFWRDLVYLYLFSCLLAVDLIVPDVEETAKSYLGQLEQLHANA